MKIRINESEAYEVNFPAGEMNYKAFVQLLDRLNRISKVIGKDNLMMVATPDEDIPEQRTSGYKKYQKLKLSREDIVELVRAYYSGDKKLKQKIYERHKVNQEIMGQKVFGWKTAHKIKPSEVRLIRFPKFSEIKHIDRLRIK